MPTASAAEIQALFDAAAKVDWNSVAKAVESHFSDRKSDMTAIQSLEPLVADVAPIIAPYVVLAVGSRAVPILGALVPVLVPAIALAVFEYKGGDADPEVDANAYDGRGGRGN